MADPCSIAEVSVAENDQVDPATDHTYGDPTSFTASYQITAGCSIEYSCEAPTDPAKNLCPDAGIVSNLDPSTGVF